MPGDYRKFTPYSLARYIDHTQLRAQAVGSDFGKLCAEAAAYRFKMVAINPVQTKRCVSLLKGLWEAGGAEVAVGAAVGFPLGQNSIAVKAAEALEAIEDGAAEIDYVINITALKEKNYGYVEQEMARIVELCRERGAVSKVIFENCYLSDEEKRELCRVALAVGPDFIKTSTGFGPGGALVEDLRLMKNAVGDRIKIKAAGGIRSLDAALEMIDAGAERVGTSAGTYIVEELKKRLQA